MKSIITATFFLPMVGCVTKDPITTQIAYLVNDTEHDITVLCFKNGVVLEEDTIMLQPNDTFLFGDGIEFGDIRVPGFTTQYAGTNIDPVIVVFNDTTEVYHYAGIIHDSTIKYHTFFSERNIYNPKNYEFIIIRDKKTGNINYHYYHFIEEDYQYAIN